MAGKTKPVATASFGKELFRFLEELRLNNDRVWFQEHKSRFETEVKAPLLAFIGDFETPLAEISPHFEADPRPSGGSMFRIFRDTRFSKDKSPYKTHAAAQFRHRACHEDGVHGLGFYLHLEPGGSFGGGGIWHPEPSSLKKIRDAIAVQPKEWQGIRDSGLEVLGDALKRVPAGYDPQQPWAEDLKRKDFYLGTDFSDSEVLAPDFLNRYVQACRRAVPLVAFLCQALNLEWS